MVEKNDNKFSRISFFSYAIMCFPGLGEMFLSISNGFFHGSFMCSDKSLV